MTGGGLLAARAVNLVECIEEKEMDKIRLCQWALAFQCQSTERGNDVKLLATNISQAPV